MTDKEIGNKFSITLGELIALSPNHATKIDISVGSEGRLQRIKHLWYDKKENNINIECK